MEPFILSATALGAFSICHLHMARLAQSADRKALNLVVVGSSPTVGECMQWLQGVTLCELYIRL